jgi:hypothetical protein
VRVVNIQPGGFWGLWCRPAAGVVVGRNDYAVEVVVRVVVDEGLGYAVVMAVVEVVVEGFDYAVELRGLALAGRGYPGCIASLRASLAPY